MNRYRQHVFYLVMSVVLTIVITSQASQARPMSEMGQVDIIQAPPRDPFPAATFTLTSAITPDPTTTPTVMPSFTPRASREILGMGIEIGTIVDTVTDAGDFRTLLAAVEATALVDALNAEGPLTVFAPTDEAFAAALEALGLEAEKLLADTETLTNILLYHVVAGELTGQDVVNLDGQSVPTLLEGAEIAISVDNDGNILINETVMVVLPNVFASNGVIHVIDGVLLPPAISAAVAGERFFAEATIMAAEATLAQARINVEEALAAQATLDARTAIAQATVDARAAAIAQATADARATVNAEAIAAAQATLAQATADARAAVIASAPPIARVCLVTDQGGIDDGNFNQLATVGMNQAGADFGLETTVIESSGPSDFAPNIQTCIETGHDVVITVGFLLTDATLAAAETNPNVYFIGVDQFFDGGPENLVGNQFREDQAGFLVGVLAARMTESNVIAGVYGIDVPAVVKFRHGFEQGARYINPDITVLGEYGDSFIDPAGGANTAEQFMGEGADVIFGAGGATGTGGIQYAAAEGVWVIGVDQDEYFTNFGSGRSPGAQFLITSALKRVDVGVYDMLAALVGEPGYTWMGGGVYTLEAANDGIGIAPSHDADVPQEVIDEVLAIFEMLKSGELDTGVHPLTGEIIEFIGAPAEEVEEETGIQQLIIGNVYWRTWAVPMIMLPATSLGLGPL